MVEPILEPTFGPRTDHQMLSSKTTKRDVALLVVRPCSLFTERRPSGQTICPLIVPPGSVELSALAGGKRASKAGVREGTQRIGLSSRLLGWRVSASKTPVW